MAKAKTNAGNANKSGAGKRATMTRSTKTTTAKRTAAKTATKPAARTTTRRAATKTAAKRSHKARAQEGASAPLRPIRQRQTRKQILATIATDSGVERPIVERVARSLSHTLTRHLMRNGSGRVDIPYLEAALWRGHEGARPARKMASPILKGRIVEIPARRAMSVVRIRVHSALREIVARA